MAQPIQFAAGTLAILAAEGDAPRRAIMGVAVPYGPTATVADGTKVRFAAGSLPIDGKAPRVLMFHDANRPVGVVTERVETADGMLFTARIAATSAGDEALTLAAEGVIDAVSVGVTPTRYSYDDAGVMVIEAAEWNELSLVPMPAFAGATIEQVAAAAEVSTPDADPAPIHETDEVPSNVPSESEVTPEMDQTPAPETVEASSVFAEPRRPFRLPAFSEYVAAWRVGGADFAQLNANIRAASPSPFVTAAAGDETTAEADGILPEPILGPIYDAINAQRPLVSAVGTRAMPAAGKVFIRPKVKTRTEVAEQTSELAQLATRSFETEDIQVTKATYGGRVLVSEQVIDWSSPSMLDAVLADLAAEYAMTTEGAACDEVYDALSGGNKGYAPDTGTDPDKWIEALYACAAQIAGTSNYLPTHILVHPTRWASMGSLVDGDERPVFPYLGPVNASGTMGANSYTANPLGLSLVVSKEFDKVNAEDLVVLFNARGLEFYETPKGSVSVNVPDRLGVSLAFRGYFAPLVIDDTKISFFQVVNQ